MTQEQKDKLLKYLSMALPYGVMVQDDMGRTYKLELGNAYLVDLYYNNGDYVEAPIKPYLRPMSSMTEEEKGEYGDRCYFTLNCIYENQQYYFNQLLNWLLAHHFDFMGLIPMGSAIEVTEENNPYKD